MKALDLKMKEYHFKEIVKGALVSAKWDLMVTLQTEDFQKVFEWLLQVGEAARVDILFCN